MPRLLSGLALGAIVLFATPSQAAIISEFAPDQPGIDGLQQRIELSGLPGMSFSGFVLGIGGESNRFGTVDTVSRISGTFDPNGLLVSTIGDLLDPSHTIVLVEDYDESAGPTDIDTNDDGIADNLSRLVGIQDAIGIADSMTDLSRLYGSQLGGQDFAFTGDQPQLVFRDASVGNWYAINNPPNGQVFDINASDVASSSTFNGNPFIDSFGAINPSVISAVPEPSTTLAIGTSFAICFIRRNRRRRSKTI
ncbi:PEP-CTERM sorting domain-containing protein [Rubripirellula reticaptiva]|uniref:PEP-CTERM protein-sorting domain-containing protein n=1 Tax=Rubripirellula reticaptiva TaxID=2528013 RepID=A0A5C6ECL9_9BACT|nr:PEP-CTERM sorting domain-containing protein [Rubripirellula reticaptiva]TWU46648.1 hypothetical protein Poly59_56210 [Rubripirellula reticaptiva]